MTGDLISVVFYLVVLIFCTIFTLMSFSFSPAKASPDQIWRGPVFSGFSFVFWTVLASIHSYVCATFGATGLISVAYLWYVLAAFFLILTTVFIFQTFQIRRSAKEWSV
jgi:uncharacterized membrane protein YedE/YeeE